MSAVRDTSEEVLRVQEGSLYPALHRMEESGWIRAKWVDKGNGRLARIYELTASGKKQLAAEEACWTFNYGSSKPRVEDGLRCQFGPGSLIFFEPSVCIDFAN